MISVKSDESNMDFNINNFDLMSYTVKNVFEYKTREGTTITIKNNVVYLRIVMSDTAKLPGQNEKVAANLRSRAG